MSVTVDIDAARKFLDWYFSETGELNVGFSFQRPYQDPVKAAQGKSEVTPRVFTSVDHALRSTAWSERSPTSKVFYCTTPLFRKEHDSNTAANAAAWPAFWVDIDGLRDINTPNSIMSGDELWQELRDIEESSCWVRSSTEGIQALFKLDKPIFFAEEDVWEEPEKNIEDMDEEELEMYTSTHRRQKPKKLDRNSPKQQLYDGELEPLLCHIVYHFGGDFNAVSPGRLLRVPGTINIKYNPPVQAYGTPTDTVYTMAELRKRFPQDLNRVPQLVFFAIGKLMMKHCAPHNNHGPLLSLWGSVRKSGMDRDSCLVLCKRLCKFLGTTEDESTHVNSTYDGDIERMSSLYGEDYGDIAEDMSRVLKYWIDLKIEYAKKLHIDWKPERTGNPIEEKTYDGIFFEKDGKTWWNNPNPKKGNELPTTQIANFTLRTAYQIIRKDDATGKVDIIDYACMHFQGADYYFEWPQEKDTDFVKFKTLKGLPPKCSFTQRALWGDYMTWLGDRPAPPRRIEAKTYGIVDFEKGKGTLLLPGVASHPEYVLKRSTYDTASHDLEFKPLPVEIRQRYLTDFAKTYPTYHNPHYIWPALGWFVSAVFNEIVWHTLKGFPILHIWGLSGSGKTFLVKNVLGNHFGTAGLRDFRQTTPFSNRAALASNNIVPLLMDEFTTNDKLKVEALIALINMLYNRNYRDAMGMDGESSVVRPVSGCVISGEHSYTQDSAVQRSYTLKVTLDYLQHLETLEPAERVRLHKYQDWLERPEHLGSMLNVELEWMVGKYERIADIYTKAQTQMEAACPKGTVPRIVTTRAIVYGGLLCLREIYRDYDLKFPIRQKDMLAYVLEGAANAGNTSDVYGSNGLQVLWQKTDFAIMEALRSSRSLAGSLYTFDNARDDRDIIYFQTTRWYEYLSPLLRNTQGLSITHFGSFKDLLAATANTEGSCILEYPSNESALGDDVCKCSMSRLRRDYKINTDSWRTFIPNDEDNENG